MAIYFSASYTAINQTILGDFKVSASEPSSIMVSTKVIEDLGATLSSSVSADNANVQIGFAKSDDLTAYCADVCNYKIAELSNNSFNLDKVENTVNDNSNDDGDNDVQVNQVSMNVNDDIFVSSASAKDKASIDWVKPNNNLYSGLIVINPATSENKASNNDDLSITLSYTAQKETSIQFLLPLLMLSTLFLGCAIIIFIHSRNKRRSGKHGGNTSPLARRKFKNADIFLPKSEQILNVREFSNKYNNSNDSQINVAAQVNFFNSNISNNNLSTNSDTEVLVNMSDTFNAANELRSANADNHDYSMLGRTRKELRDIIPVDEDGEHNNEQ